MSEKLICWESNPAAYGCVHARIGHGRIGGISHIGEMVRGYLGSEQVYDGDDEDAAMLAVETAFGNLPECAKELIRQSLERKQCRADTE